MSTVGLKRNQASIRPKQPPQKRIRSNDRTPLPNERAATATRLTASLVDQGQVAALAIAKPAGLISSRNAPASHSDLPAQSSSNYEHSGLGNGSGNSTPARGLPSSSGIVLPVNPLSSSSLDSGSDDLPKLVRKCQQTMDRFFQSLQDDLQKRGLTPNTITKITTACIQSAVRKHEVPLSDQAEVPSSDMPNPRYNPRLLSKAPAILNPTQAFEASSYTRRASDDDSPGRLPSPGGLFLTEANDTDNEHDTERDDNDNDDDDDDDNNENIVVIDLGQDSKARRKSNTPTTLVGALLARQHKTSAGQGELEGDSFDMLAIATRLEARDFDNKVTNRDICALGGAVLGDVFGIRGQKRLVEAFIYLYARQGRQPLDRVLQGTADGVAQKIRQAGSTILSDFTTQWARAVQHDSPRASATEDIQAIYMKVSLVRQWEAWSQPSRLRTDKELERFLDGKGIDHTKHAPLSNRISKYLSRELGFPAKQLTKKIYNWTPLAIMADTFGQGIFALMPKSLLTSYNSLRVTDGNTKEVKFRAIVVAIAEELPELCEICDYCDEYIVKPIISGSLESGRASDFDMKVPGIDMAVTGNLQKLRKTSICGLLRKEVHMPPLGSVQELGGTDLDSCSEDGGN